MCGRYSFFTPMPEVEQTLGAKALPIEGWQPQYNGAPSMAMPVITNEFPGVIQYFRWGLVPRWAPDIAVGSKMINTRRESIEEKPAFRNIFKYRRCLVLADGYYEWMPVPSAPLVGKKQKTVKQPYRIHLPHNELMLLAGLWEQRADGLQTFSIITCPANDDLRHLHERMPVLLTHAAARTWLQNEVPPEELLTLLQPAPNGVLQYYPIDTLLNKPVYNEPDIIAPVAVSHPAQTSLF
jgi:putative SOS response-associated peptidase YedK